MDYIFVKNIDFLAAIGTFWKEWIAISKTGVTDHAYGKPSGRQDFFFSLKTYYV